MTTRSVSVHQCGWGRVDGVWRCVQDHYAAGRLPRTGCGATWDAATGITTRPAAQVQGPSRWEVNRSRGIRQGYVDEAGDQLTRAAEDHVGQLLGVPTVGVLDGRDPGWDLVYRGLKVDVKHTVHERGHLAVPWAATLLADAYVLVTGRSAAAFIVRGWATRAEVLAGDRVDHGHLYHGKPRVPYYSLRQDQLHDMAELGLVASR